MKDVSDWLNAGHTKAELYDLIKRTPVYTSTSEDEAIPDVVNVPVLTRLSDVQPETINWLWERRFPHPRTNAAKHGGRGRRGWRKLHLGVDQSGVIRVHTLTEATSDDATTALDLLTAVDGPLVRITADAASDTVAIDETARARGATVVVPPARTATVSGHGPRSPARDRTIPLAKTLGRCRWKQVSGSHRQGRVENTCFRDTSIIGEGLRARSPAGQGSEVVLGCEILNRMTELGRPVSYRIGR